MKKVLSYSKRMATPLACVATGAYYGFENDGIFSHPSIIPMAITTGIETIVNSFEHDIEIENKTQEKIENSVVGLAYGAVLNGAGVLLGCTARILLFGRPEFY